MLPHTNNLSTTMFSQSPGNLNRKNRYARICSDSDSIIAATEKTKISEKCCITKMCQFFGWNIHWVNNRALGISEGISHDEVRHPGQGRTHQQSALQSADRALTLGCFILILALHKTAGLIFLPKKLLHV
jgi:hypothetical protein